MRCLEYALKWNKSVHLPAWLSFLCVLGDLWVIWAGNERKITQSARSANRAQITYKSPKRHKKYSQAGKWTLLLHFSAYSGHRIIPIHSYVRITLTLPTCGVKKLKLGPSYICFCNFPSALVETYPGPRSFRGAEGANERWASPRRSFAPSAPPRARKPLGLG